MKTYLFNIIPKLQQYSQKLDNTALLTSQHWVVIDDDTTHKVTYIFRPNNDLLISQAGHVQKAKWDYLGNQTLLIDRQEKSYLFKHGFFNEQVLALKVDGRDEYALLVAEQQFESGVNSLDQVMRFLEAFLKSHSSIANAKPTGIGASADNQFIIIEDDNKNDWGLFIIAAIIVCLGVYMLAQISK